MKTALWVLGLAVAVGCGGSEPEGGGDLYRGFVVEFVQTDPPSILAACLEQRPAVEEGQAVCEVTGETAEGPLEVGPDDWTYQPAAVECPSEGTVRFDPDAVPPANAYVRIECLAP